MRRLSALAPILAASITASCARCDAPRGAPDAGRPIAPEVITLLPPPRPWTFARVRLDAGIALPEGCRLRAPLARAQVSSLTRFVAEPRSPGTLIIADATDASPPTLTGVAALSLDPEGATRDPVPLPWLEPGALPRLARAGARWIAAIDRPGADSAKVMLWRGAEAEQIGEGDGFEAIDLACDPSERGRCALLTSRPLKVSAPGATVWIGAPAERASAWKPTEIVPAAPDSDARPLGITLVDAERVDLALIEKSAVVFHEITASGARERARVPAPHGAMDAIALPRPVILAFASPTDEEGCARDGRPGVRIAREGASDIDFALPASPAHGGLRRLARGALATWIAPVGCRVARKVVYALMIDEQGAPVGTPIPVGDAAAFAVATSGEDVDLWLQEQTSVTWVRARCAPKGG